jgi:hypothetical protein
MTPDNIAGAFLVAAFGCSVEDHQGADQFFDASRIGRIGME